MNVYRKVEDKEMSVSVQTACIECGADLALEDVVVGEIVQCPECGVELEVLNLAPVELGLAPAEEEDWGE